MTTQADGDYLVGEAKHLLWCGMTPEHVATTLNRSASSIAQLSERRGEHELAKVFWQLKTQQQKG